MMIRYEKLKKQNWKSKIEKVKLKKEELVRKKEKKWELVGKRKKNLGLKYLHFYIKTSNIKTSISTRLEWVLTI